LGDIFQINKKTVPAKGRLFRGATQISLTFSNKKAFYLQDKMLCHLNVRLTLPDTATLSRYPVLC